MGIVSLLAKIFRRGKTPPAPVVIEKPAATTQSVAIYQSPNTESIDPNRLAIEFRDQLHTQAESQRQLSTLLTSLSTTLDALPQLARQQGQVLETLLESSAKARHRDQVFEKNLSLLAEGASQQTQVLGLVQQQLDLNHEVSLRVADSLRETAGAMTTFAATSDRQVKAIEVLAQSTQRRVANAERLEKAIQFWMAIVAVICTLALIYAIYAATRGPIVIAMPQPAPPQPSPVVQPVSQAPAATPSARTSAPAATTPAPPTSTP